MHGETMERVGVLYLAPRALAYVKERQKPGERLTQTVNRLLMEFAS